MAKDNEVDVKIACLSNRATCYAQFHNYKKVIEDATKVLELDPKHVKALIRRGLAYEATEKYKLGLEDMRQAQAVSGGSPVISQVWTLSSLFFMHFFNYLIYYRRFLVSLQTFVIYKSVKRRNEIKLITSTLLAQLVVNNPQPRPFIFNKNT